MKEKLFEKAITWAEKNGFKEIKANTDDFDTPSAFSREGKDPIIPDITGWVMGRKSYAEIALKGEDRQSIISKWKLFNTLASSKGGKLYLLAARGNKAFADKIVEDYNLMNAKVVSI